MPRLLVAAAGLVVALAVPGAQTAQTAQAGPVPDAPPDHGNGALFAPVVAADGHPLVGPDGRERCVVVGPPPAALAAPRDAPGSPAATGYSVEIVDRPLTLADTVPCR